jgi:hypothetical protein
MQGLLKRYSVYLLLLVPKEQILAQQAPQAALQLELGLVCSLLALLVQKYKF